MTTTIQKWGNSYAVRLPKAEIERLRLRAGQLVSIKAGKGRSLSIEPISKRSSTLAQLAARITHSNRHAGIDWGRPVGKEVW